MGMELVSGILGALRDKDKSQLPKLLAATWLDVEVPPDLVEEVTDLMAYTAIDNGTFNETRVALLAVIEDEADILDGSVASIKTLKRSLRNFGQPPVDKDNEEEDD